MSHQLPHATALYIQVREDNQARLIELLKTKEVKQNFQLSFCLAAHTRRKQKPG